MKINKLIQFDVLISWVLCYAFWLSPASASMALFTNETDFQEATEYYFNTSGSNNTFSRSVATGDIDGDGDIDVAVGDRFSDEILLLLNCGQGTLSPPQIIESDGGHHNRIIIFEDLNGDSFLDIASASGTGAAIFLNRGTSAQGEWLGYSQVTIYTAGSDPHWIDAVDINGDNHKDLLVANYGTVGFETGWHIFINAGDGTFLTSIEFNIGFNARCISIIGEDLDGDKDKDIVVVTQSEFMHVYENLGNNDKGNWNGVSLKRSIAVDTSTCSLRSLDLELDGDVDLVVAQRDLPQFTLLKNLGGWNFELEAIPASYTSELIEPADLNNDGYTDLTVVNKVHGTFTVYVNNGSGQFVKDFGSSTNTDANSKFIAFGDLDTDGDLDAILVNAYPSVDWGSIGVFMNNWSMSRMVDETGDCYSNVWSVDDNGSADFASIQDAIDAASDGDEIVVMPGTYTSSIGNIVDLQGKSLWLHSINGSEATMIDGQGQNCRGILCVNNQTNETIIEGFTILNCVTQEAGAGMLCINASPTVKNCEFINNISMNSFGGGMHNSGSDTELYDCIFIGNSAVKGGGVSIVDSNPIIARCQITDNIATLGGGIFNEDSNATLFNTLICHNEPDQIEGEFVDEGGNMIAALCFIDCPDFDGNQHVDVDDLLQLIGAWGNSDVVEDLNIDGTVDVNDLLLLLGHWGPCE